MQAVLDQGQLWLLEPTGVQHWRLETAGGERGGQVGLSHRGGCTETDKQKKYT